MYILYIERQRERERKIKHEPVAMCIVIYMIYQDVWSLSFSFVFSISIVARLLVKLESFVAL
jgi:hypothetical protein